MAASTHTSNEEIPDSLFRNMILKNIVSIGLIFLINIGVTTYLYFNILEAEFRTDKFYSLSYEKNQIQQEDTLFQRYIRVLKGSEVRRKTTASFGLVDRFKLNRNSENYLFELDKELYDHLKVEEQNDATVRVSYTDKNPAFAEQLTETHAQFAFNMLGKRKGYTLNLIRETTCKIGPRFLSVFLLISVPVLLAYIIFIAIKEKIFLSIK